MSEFVTGIPIGMAIGIAIGFAISGNKKPWSELTDEEKKQRKIMIGIGCLTCIFATAVFFIQLF